MRQNAQHEIYTLKERTWFGAQAVVEIRSAGLHRAGYGRLLLPHPPLINGLLRYGLAQGARRRLGAIHELGHLQALPLEMVYGVIAFSVTIARGHDSLPALITVLAGCFAAWEMLAEAYTMGHEAALYRRAYRSVSPLPRILFWSITMSLTLACWAIALW